MFRASFWLTAFAASISVAADRPVDFNRDVRPILSDNCYFCHGPDEATQKAGLRIDTRAGAIDGEVIVPGKPAESELIHRVLSTESDELMPPPETGKKLSAADKDTLRRWVAQGAHYAVHWAYEKPTRPAVPEAAAADVELRNPVDRFVQARLQQDGLTLQPEADRYALARRAALDLTGLPPTPEAVAAFVADKSDGAFERYVDQLLAEPAFGEHWARMWLDLARYADSAGYADDPSRTIWAYRDYVIRSFNANKPFDRFTVEQIAGDLLPDPTEDQMVATAFHRNTLTNSEGGTDDEEFRNVAVVDRVNTTMAVWMGTSMACAQCHTHKFDPITQTEYFQMFAFFNNTADADRKDESPVYQVGDTPAKQARRATITAAANKLEQLGKFQPAVIQGVQKIQSDRLRKELTEHQPVTTVPVFRELDGKARRTTKVQIRGNFMATSDVVTEGVPAAFPPLPKDAPLNRLTLANWLVADDNPLTARVAVNRFWEHLFGSGLVRTPEEFGSQGEPPTHPQLLDWLAVEFRETGWDVKRLLKLMVTSAAYRQSVSGDAGVAGEGPGQPTVVPRPTVPPVGRDGPGSGVGRQRAALPEDARPVGEAAATGVRPDCGIRREHGLEDQPGRRQVPPRPVHRMAADQPVPVDGRVRRPESGGVYDPPGPDEHAIAGTGHAERPGVRRVCPGVGTKMLDEAEGSSARSRWKRVSGGAWSARRRTPRRTVSSRCMKPRRRSSPPTRPPRRSWPPTRSARCRRGPTRSNTRRGPWWRTCY